MAPAFLTAFLRVPFPNSAHTKTNANFPFLVGASHMVQISTCGHQEKGGQKRTKHATGEHTNSTLAGFFFQESHAGVIQTNVPVYRQQTIPQNGTHTTSIRIGYLSAVPLKSISVLPLLCVHNTERRLPAAVQRICATLCLTVGACPLPFPPLPSASLTHNQQLPCD